MITPTLGVAVTLPKAWVCGAAEVEDWSAFMSFAAS